LSNEALDGVADLIEVVVEDVREVAAGGASCLDVLLHQIDVVGAQSEVIGDTTELLYLVSEYAVESNTCLEKADITPSEADLIANLANIAAALKEQFNFLWVGFYIVRGNELVLGPFQGPVACTRIKPGKGVCGAAWEQNTIQVVPDVEQFPGHIACSSLSKSEIVLPLSNLSGVWGVLDIDSSDYASFDDEDVSQLKRIVSLITFEQ
jgi:GAF domain-containing protein